MSVIFAASGVRNYTGSWTDISGTEGGRWTDGRLFGTHYIDGTTLGKGNDPLSQGRFAEKGVDHGESSIIGRVGGWDLTAFHVEYEPQAASCA